MKYLISTNTLEEQKGYGKIVTVEADTLFQNPYVLPLGILSRHSLTDTTFNYNAFLNINAVWKGLTGGKEDIYKEEEHIHFKVHESMDGAIVNKQEAEKDAGETQISSLMNCTTSDAGNPSVSCANAADWISGTAYIEYYFPAAQDGAVYAYNGGAMTEEYGGLLSPMHWNL